MGQHFAACVLHSSGDFDSTDVARAGREKVNEFILHLSPAPSLQIREKSIINEQND